MSDQQTPETALQAALEQFLAVARKEAAIIARKSKFTTDNYLKHAQVGVPIGAFIALLAAVEGADQERARLQGEITRLTEALRACEAAGGQPGANPGLLGNTAPATSGGSTPAAALAWQPIASAPKDGQWFWARSGRSRLCRVSAFKWDDRNGNWFAGTGWWHRIEQHFEWWAPMESQPPAPPTDDPQPKGEQRP